MENQDPLVGKLIMNNSGRLALVTAAFIPNEDRYDWAGVARTSSKYYEVEWYGYPEDEHNKTYKSKFTLLEYDVKMFRRNYEDYRASECKVMPWKTNLLKTIR